MGELSHDIPPIFKLQDIHAMKRSLSARFDRAHTPTGVQRATAPRLASRPFVRPNIRCPSRRNVATSFQPSPGRRVERMDVSRPDPYVDFFGNAGRETCLRAYHDRCSLTREGPVDEGIGPDGLDGVDVQRNPA